MVVVLKKLFSERDVCRWDTNIREDIEILERRLGTSPLLSSDVQALNMLSLTLTDFAFTQFARGECEKALGQLRSAVQLKCRIFELHTAGDNLAQGYIRAGEFQTVLHGFASGDAELARRFAELYRVDEFTDHRSPNDSSYIGFALKSLALGEIDKVRAFLLQNRPPKVDDQFFGYVECVSALASRDLSAFSVALQSAEIHWHSFMSKKFRGHPQAVCFVGGLGFQRLAELILDVKLDAAFCCSFTAR